MRKRAKSLTLAVAALAVLALGGSALANASGTEPVSATDAGPAIQQGDQRTPDNSASAARHHATRAAVSQPVNDPAGVNDTTSADTGSAAGENSAENGSEAEPSDGPGGHEDPAGDAQNEYEGPGEG
jgi:hypothetical protein